MTRTKAISILLFFCACASLLDGFAPYPCVLTAKYQDKMLPVIRLVGTDPIVLVNGKEKRIRDFPIYLLQRADGFSDNYVESPGGAMGGRLKIETLIGEAPERPWLPSDRTYFDAPLRAQKMLKGGFAVVMIYARRNFESAPSNYNRPEMLAHEVPELPAGQTVQVRFTGQGTNRMDEHSYFILIFDSSGREVPTNDMEHAWLYFALRDLSHLTHALEKYLEKFKGMDHAPVPALVPKPVLLNGLTPPKGTVSAAMTVSALGQVSQVEVQGVDDEKVRQAIVASVEGWLFLPKLEAGQPVSSRVSIPLDL